jgi:tellurite resistance protein TerC
LPYRYARRIVIAIVGGCMVLVGIAMLVLPGPGLIVIPAGLGVLALEFAWARLWLKKLKTKGKQVLSSVTGGKGGNSNSSGAK